jgi:large subunit ribosomal protein L13
MPRTSSKTKAATEEKAPEKKPRPASSAKTNKTIFANALTTDRKWYLIDAKDKNLGRLAVEIAKILRGKRKASYTPNVDTGDFVVVINAKHVTFTGKNKAEQTKYYRYTGHPGGLRIESLGELLKRIPERVIFNTVKGMLPKESTLARAQLKKLKIYADDKHPHAAQQPTIISEIPLI